MSRRRKRKGKGKKRSTAHLRKYQYRKKGRKRHMAKRRVRRRRRSSGRRTTHRRTHRRRHGGFGGGGGRGIAAVKHDAPNLLLAGLYGVVEKKAAGDDNFILNKIPRPIAALGYTGNIAAALYLATMVTHNKWVRRGASVVATIALYKMGKNGGAFQSSDKTTIGDDDYMAGDEQVIDSAMMGALEAEGMAHTTQPGLKYDDVVTEAGTRV